MLRSRKREDIAAFVENAFQEVKNERAESLCYTHDRKTIDDPEIVPIESLDMFTAPHFQQGRIANEYAMEDLIVVVMGYRTMPVSRRR